MLGSVPWGSLRVRLPALFLLGIVLAGVVAALISIRFFQGYTRARAVDELRSESVGIVRLYAQQAGHEEVPLEKLERAIGGDRIFYAPIVPGADLYVGTLTKLPPSVVDAKALGRHGPQTMNVTYGGEEFLAVASPIRLGPSLLGSLVVAKPTSQLHSRLVDLVQQLAIAFGAGIVIVGLLGVWLTRRLTEPLGTLAVAADEIAAGDYAVQLPPSRGSDEISTLSRRFGDMAAKLAESEQLSRNFLMSVSHELRTPLTAIRGHVSALREGVIDDPDMHAASLAVIEEEAMRLERLVGDVLDLAKLDAHRFTVLQEEVDMEHLCERAFTAFAEQARRRAIDYRRELDGHPVIVTDGDRVLQIISNLLANAFRWTPEGGRIWLELSASDGTVSVAVSDTGPGISAEEKERIFRPFWSRDGGGTGLGLAIARELAVALGGRIELRSELGLGSRFELVLPAHAPVEVPVEV
jgi:signal transduction histidine kinase